MEGREEGGGGKRTAHYYPNNRHEDQACKLISSTSIVSASALTSLMVYCMANKAFITPRPHCWSGALSQDRHPETRGNVSEATYITGVDKPRYLSIGSKLTIHITSKLTVLPSVVNVHYSYHVPLSKQK